MKPWEKDGKIIVDALGRPLEGDDPVGCCCPGMPTWICGAGCEVHFKETYTLICDSYFGLPAGLYDVDYIGTIILLSGGEGVPTMHWRGSSVDCGVAKYQWLTRFHFWPESVEHCKMMGDVIREDLVDEFIEREQSGGDPYGWLATFDPPGLYITGAAEFMLGTCEWDDPMLMTFV